MNQKEKNKTLLTFGLVIVVMVLLASSLPRLDLQPGMPLPEMINSKLILRSDDQLALVSVEMREFFMIVMSILLMGCFLYAFYKFITGCPWRELRTILLNYFIFIFILTIGILFFVIFLPHGELTPMEEMKLEIPPPPVSSPLGAVPPGLLWVAGIILLVLLVLASLWVFSMTTKKDSVVDKIKLEAERAQRALLTGQNYKDVIIRCYKQMNFALAEDQKIERQDFMTAREFEAVIKAAGIAPDPIHQLTQLFENVRYGHFQASPEDDQVAIQCLEDLIHSCSEFKPGT